MEKSRIKLLNKIYLIFLIFVLIIIVVFSFKSGKQMFYLVNTNLNDKDTPVKTDIANWKIEVSIEY